MFIMLALLFILSVPVLFAREPSFKMLMTLGAMVLALALAPHANAAGMSCQACRASPAGSAS